MEHALPRRTAGAPRTWSLCMTSENHGTVGPAGCPFSHAPEKHERVLVVEALAGTRAPVAEFKGYVDGQPAVTWFDRDNMPRVGAKLFAGNAAADVEMDAGFLQWLHDRMRFVHGENENVDYMHKLRAIIASVPVDKKTTNVASITPPATTGARTEDTEFLKFTLKRHMERVAELEAAQAGQVAVPGWIDIDATEPPEHELIALRYWPYGNSENPQAVTGGRYIDGTYYNDEGDEMHPPSHWCRLPYFDAEATAKASTSGERQEGGQS